jgi:hypothetical protein
MYEYSIFAFLVFDGKPPFFGRRQMARQRVHDPDDRGRDEGIAKPRVTNHDKGD